MNKKISALLIAAILTLSSCSVGNMDNAANTTAVPENTASEVRTNTFGEDSPFANRYDDAFHEKYTLKEVVALSRHNIRSPLSDKDSVLGRVTPHEWFEWSSGQSELSMRGGALETMMGQYFRKWLADEELLPENYMPSADEVRFYANSKQRTIATAQYFSSGMFPVANVEIEHHAEYDKMDPVFNPQLTFVTDKYAEDALAQINEMGGDKGLEGVCDGLKDAYALISDVLDMNDSQAYKSGEVTGFETDDTVITLEEGKEPAMTGSLKLACQISDALVLQCYEENDLNKAAFGKELSEEQWKQISSVKDTYGDVLFTAPLVAANVAHPLLEEIRSELTSDGRKFTFLCGHDSNIGSVCAALGNEEYTLPDSIESKTPIGSKLLFERWASADDSEYIAVRLVYQSTGQLRDLSLLDMNHPPMSFDMTFRGIEKNEDGLYRYDDFMQLMNNAINEYDRIVNEYDAAAMPDAA